MLMDERTASEPATRITHEIEEGPNGVCSLTLTHELDGAPVLAALVAETSGVAEHMVRAAVDYWADYPHDVDVWVDRAERESKAAEERWRREHRLLAG